MYLGSDPSVVTKTSPLFDINPAGSVAKLESGLTNGNTIWSGARGANRYGSY